MISLDQVLLLQEKVETAVRKITDLTEKNVQLKNENDALRSKCAELSKALSEKTELVSSFENQQDKIEKGIISALKKLDGLEDAVLSSTNESRNIESETSDSVSAPQASFEESSETPAEPENAAPLNTPETSTPYSEEPRGSLMQKAEEFEEYADAEDTSYYAESSESESSVNDNFDIF